MTELEKAIEIIKKLQNNKYEAYIIGGAVRDKLLGIEPKDYDIVTNAKPGQIKELFSDRKLSFVGEQFKVMIVDGVEVATYRGERYDKAGKPTCNYVDTLKEDCGRRDFTINAIAWNPVTDEYIDYFGGQKDIKNKKIRFIGKPKDRLDEDPIRALRGLRFSVKYGFDFVGTHWNEIKKFDDYDSIPMERFKIEFDKVLECRNFLWFFSQLPKSIKKNLTKSFKKEELLVSGYVDIDKKFRLPYLWYLVNDYEKQLRELKYSNEEIKNVKKYLSTRCHHFSGCIEYFKLKRIAIDIKNKGVSVFDWCDFNCLFNSEINMVVQSFNMLRIKEKIQAYTIKDLKINGDDVQSITGFKGKKVGDLLQEIFDLVFYEKINNNREELIKYLEEDNERKSRNIK